MSTIPARSAVCWVPARFNEDAEWIPHFQTKAEALDLDDPGAPEARPLVRRCVTLVCDGCAGALDRDGELTYTEPSMHLDPADLVGVVESEQWTEPDPGRHLCTECTRAAPPPRHLSREPGPDDVPLPLVIA